jgi:phospholipid/cholesterol/gamma-HCH transport system substrate-binding protein
MNAVSFQPTYTITARFDNIGGLKPRAPVKSAGVVVGRIADIRFDDTTYQATVTMTLERSYQFPKDSAAKILTSGLLGEQYVGLEAGGSDQMLAQGNMITQTQSAVVLENLISQFLYNKAADGGKDESAKK